MPKILIGLSVLHAPREIGPLIEALIDQGWDVRILVGTDGIGDAVGRWHQRGATLLYPPAGMGYAMDHGPATSPPAATPSDSVPAEGAAPQRRAIVPRPLRPLVATWRQWRGMKARRRFARALVAEQCPDVLLYNNFHSCGRLDDAVLLACIQAGIPTACMLVSPLVGKAIAQPGRLCQFESGMMNGVGRIDESWFARLMACLFPHWHASDDVNTIFMWPPDSMLAARLSGMLATDVWHTPRLEFDRVYAHNAFSMNLLGESGYPMDKVRQFGPPRVDPALHEATQPESWRNLGLAGPVPYILWNIEPSWEHNYCDMDTHWQRVSAIAALLAATDKPVVIALHPLCKPDDYAFLARDHGFTIATAGIERLYAGAAFALSFPCSTNYYALVFAKRVLMYDWFGVRATPRRWKIYNQPHLEVVETMDALAAALNRFVAEHTWEATAGTLHLPQPAIGRIIADLTDLVQSPKECATCFP